MTTRGLTHERGRRAPPSGPRRSRPPHARAAAPATRARRTSRSLPTGGTNTAPLANEPEAAVRPTPPSALASNADHLADAHPAEAISGAAQFHKRRPCPDRTLPRRSRSEPNPRAARRRRRHPELAIGADSESAPGSGTRSGFGLRLPTGTTDIADVSRALARRTTSRPGSTSGAHLARRRPVAVAHAGSGPGRGRTTRTLQRRPNGANAARGSRTRNDAGLADAAAAGRARLWRRGCERTPGICGTAGREKRGDVKHTGRQNASGLEFDHGSESAHPSGTQRFHRGG